MPSVCATDAHSSSRYCAYYAHDIFAPVTHYGRMDTQWFKARKRERKVNDSDLAEALGVERSVANKIVNGKVEFNAWRVEAVADLLQTSPWEVLFRIGVVKTPPDPEMPVPSEAEIARMIQRAIDEMGDEASYEDYPQAVASGVHAQLVRYQADARSQGRGEVSAPDTDAPPPKPTKPSARVKSRNP